MTPPAYKVFCISLRKESKSMGRVNTLVITGYGTNSHVETAYAATQAGADRADIDHFSDITACNCSLDDYDFLIFPGGFLDGDDLGAAQAAGMRWRHLKDASGTPLLDHLKKFLSDGKLVLGICNGFQLLVKLGLLPGFDGQIRRMVSLGHNDSARFEDRWVCLLPNPKSPCVFTKNLPFMRMPVRHGEGKLVCADEACRQRLVDENLVALQYADPETKQPTHEYPYNPNGSELEAAGLTNPTGTVLGLMPHPEAFNHATNHPGWTRGEVDAPGTMLFLNAVQYLRGL